jgi:hypothetical protein
VSSHSREIAEEVHQAQYLEVLTDMAYSQAQGRIAVAGSNRCVGSAHRLSSRDIFES